VTKTFLLRVVIFLCVLFLSARGGTTQPASASFPAVSAAAGRLSGLWPSAFGSAPPTSGVLIRALADDQDHDRDQDGDPDHNGDHDCHHHKDPDPGPAPVPEPATVLLFGAALLAGGTIFRLRNRTIHK